MDYLCLPLFPNYETHTTITTTIIVCSIFFSVYNPLVSLYNEGFQTTTIVSTHNTSSHKTNWITTTRRIFYLVLSYANSLMNVLEVECSYSPLLENSIASLLLIGYFAYITCCVRVVVYLIFSYWCCCWFMYIKFDVWVSASFVYRFNVKRYLAGSIFVTYLHVYVQHLTPKDCIFKLINILPKNKRLFLIVIGKTHLKIVNLIVISLCECN